MSRDTPAPVTLEAVGMGRAEMLAISRATDAWRYDPGATDRWIQTETGEIVTAATPEGVPDNYVYVAPDEEVGDEYDVVESPQGGTYRSPEPVDDTGGGTDTPDASDDGEGDDFDDLGPGDTADLSDASNEEIRDAVNIGDVVIADTSGRGAIVAEELTAEVQFIDSDWVEIVGPNGQEWTLGTESIRFVDKEGPVEGGASSTELAEMDTRERLSDAFDHAAERKGYRESGGRGGNTTGDEMEVLEYQDGSRDFAIPVDAYNRATTGVVRSPQEAVNNNTFAPIIINELGGSAAQTEVIEDDNGDEYIVKEGIDGATLSEFSMGDADAAVTDEIDEDEFKQSATETMAAAYFTGNADLHGGNLMVDPDENELSVIDFDSGGYDRTNELLDIGRFTTPRGVQLDYAEVRASVYDKALDIRAGRAGNNLGRTDMGRYMEDAADKATRAAYIDDDYELDENEVPAEVQFPPMGIESVDDVPDPDDDPREYYEVEYVDAEGEITDGQVTDVVDGDIHIEATKGYGRHTSISDVNRLTEVRE